MVTIRDINDTKDCIVATVDGGGNRTTVTFDTACCSRAAAFGDETLDAS